MPQAALLFFALAFVAGPLLGAALLQLPPKVPVLLTLAALIVVAMALALWLQHRSALGGLLALWLGWVLAVVLVAQALRRRLPGPAPPADGQPWARSSRAPFPGSALRRP